ncbi:MAG: DNA polymerase III subunit epsilon [Desulfobulbus propionicus]|nr:MAG: DNA polymerase III subunit epsilon [Desulfobulbus propionicus]
MIGRFFPWKRVVDPLIIQNREACRQLDLKKPLEHFDFVVCDTELTGLNKRKDEIISIGAVRISNLQIALDTTYHTLVQPARIDANRATFVHRITPEQLKLAPTVVEVLPEFISFCSGAVIVGHFISMDMHFLNRVIKKQCGGSLTNPTVDTMTLAKLYKEYAARSGVRFKENPGSLVLDDLTTEFNLPRFKPHDALEDALQTAYLFLFLVKKMRDYGLTTLFDISQLVKGAREEQML